MNVSLKVICSRYGISRRAIQGYEKEGLVKPSSKSKRGYLLYDEETIGKIVFINMCQEIGFKVKEIAEFIDGPNEIIKLKLNEKISQYEQELMLSQLKVDELKRILNSTDCKNYKEVTNKKLKEDK